ncbi:MAG: helix-turn-helix transcriptional regulator [Demequinaceae bacterium]|nr:helix-turn-helix transcriptional regulator [Demequinaceae bacterium]
MLQQSDVLDRTFAALADAGRRDMLARLSLGPASVSELAVPLDMSLSAVLQHVHVLEDTGLVTTAKQGRSRIVTPSGDGLATARTWIAAHEAAWGARLDRLGSALDTLHAPNESLTSPTREHREETP